MTTVAAIAAEALNAVAGAVTDAVLSVSVASDTQGAYDPSTGSYALTTTTVNGRGVLDDKPISDVFPDYVAGPKDMLILLEGFTDVKEGYRVTFNSKTYTVKAVADIMGAGTLFMAVIA